MLNELRAVLIRDLDAAAREVEAYSSDDALWHVVPGITNPGGSLARHLAGNLRHFVGVVLGKGTYVRDRDAEFAARGLNRVAVAEELRAAAREVDAALERLSARPRGEIESLLNSPFPVLVLGKQFTTAQFLTHLVAHFGYHLGQLDYHRRMQQADAKPVAAMSLDALPTV